jgi:Ser/Thr protein kinase RdoA (MazF antagonist)
VEVVATGLGRVTAMCVATAPGDTLDADTITDGQAAAWGAALARFHVAGQSIEMSDLPNTPADRRSDETTVGLLHGDFELDNLHWNGDAVIAFDLDGVGVGSHLLDVAAAVRDLLDGGTLPEPSPRRTVLEAFFAGYSDVRPGASFDALPRFVAIDAAVRAARLRPIAAEQLPANAPAWACELQARVSAAIGEVSDVG